jgi:hypothetical protein
MNLFLAKEPEFDAGFGQKKTTAPAEAGAVEINPPG